MESSHFWPSVLHVALYKTVFLDFWFRPPNAQNLLPKICNCTKSPISRLVWHMDRRCLGLPGGIQGWSIQWEHAKCCGADPCCHGNEICTKSPISRLVWQIDQRCFGLPGGFQKCCCVLAEQEVEMFERLLVDKWVTNVNTGVQSPQRDTCHWATGRLLPYGIFSFNLPPDTSEHAPP